MAVTDAAEKRRYRGILLVILVVAGLIRLAFVLQTPAWHAPDEYAHFWIAEQIAREGILPTSTPTFPAYESFQPPLYYWLAALPLKLFPETVVFDQTPQAPPGPLIIVRLLSVLLAVMTIWIAYRFFRLMPGLRPVEALWGVGFMSLLPSFVGTGSTVTNDALVVLPSAICLWLLWQPRANSRTVFWAGVWAGLAVLTKLTGLALLPLAVLRIWQMSDRGWRVAVRRLFLFATGWAGPVSILVVRNVVMYDDWLAIMPGVPGGSGLTAANILRAIRNLTWSFWLALGHGYKVQLTPVVYLLTALPMMLVGLLGWFRVTGRRRLLVAPIGLAVGAAIAGSLTYTFSYPPGTMTSWGKNLFPVLPMIAVGLVVGWHSVWRRYPSAVPAASLATVLAGSLWGLWQLSQLV
ncbi:MAG: glycosyltransferase family 39 protein [candidate division Zixibacteria bacterium]|nr:glycosyltransferase family 39 protein [candidate division Zixibacteria bacterium]